MTQILLSAAGYVVIVFPLALVWHLGLFKEKYESFGYFAGEPNAFGFVMMETGYLVAQFGLFALLLGFIYRGV